MIERMKIFLIFLILSFFSIHSESSYRKDSKSVINKSKEDKTNKEKSNPDNFEDDELDKEFYTYYYMNLPKFLQKEEKSKSKLQSSLIQVFKKEITKRDRNVTKETLSDITQSTTKFKRVLESSKWMKKIKSELRYIQFTEYMYIIKYKKYLALILYQVDPDLHIQTPSRVEFLMVKEADPNQELE